MNYDERKRIISGWLFDTLKRYEPPAHMDDNAIREEMVLMVEDINSEIPTGTNEGGLKYILDKSAEFVRKNQASRRWPSISMFVKGVKENRVAMVEDHILIEHRPKDFDESHIMARKIKNGDPVAEWWITGGGRQQILNTGIVTHNDLAPYEKYLRYLHSGIN